MNFPGPGSRIPYVLSLTADQASPMFKAYLHLAERLGLRVIWFPDINHIESNVDSGIMKACDLDHLCEKALFLGRLHRGPKKAAGRWHGQIKQAHKAIATAYEAGDLTGKGLVDGYAPRMCKDYGLASPDNIHSKQQM